MHVVEQSEFPVYEGQHEAIISEEDWYLAQEKRKINSFKREKVNNPDHAHILSGILKCPMLRKEYVRQYRQGAQQGQENTVLLLLQKYGNTYRA
ncbi:recombinase family protein [Anaeromassilibacillus sp. SJQ-1]|uniref:recombinase family protein n=1 Tax=Anaeromassilibacillus sp. SJQ-1 TaxID=3375419 RepID=UPI0039890571